MLQSYPAQAHVAIKSAISSPGPRAAGSIRTAHGASARRVFTVGATAIVPEDQLVLVARNKFARKFLVTGQRVISGIGGHIRIQVREIGGPFVRQPSRFDKALRTTAIGWHVGADMRPEQIAMFR